VFKPQVEKGSQGAITVDVHHSGTLGNEADLWNGVRNGAIEVAIVGTPMNQEYPVMQQEADLGGRFQGAEIPHAAVDHRALSGLVDRPLLLNIMLMVVVLLVGTAMDVAPTILILTPIFLLLLKAAGIDPVYFGILFTLVNVLGLLTPPVGPMLNVACAAGKVKLVQASRTSLVNPLYCTRQARELL
jgi:hypothetical protein